MNKLIFAFLIFLTPIYLQAEDTEFTLSDEEIPETSVEIQESEDEEGIEEEIKENYTKYAKIQVLNKITAKSKYLDVPVNSQISFGTLKVRILKCLQSSPYELTENKILFEIFEKKSGQENYSPIFNGWMFSSSPSVSSLEHAVYDVTAVSCYN